MNPVSSAHESSLHIQAEQLDGVIRLRFDGELDMASEVSVERALSEAARTAGHEVVVDLSGLGFMDSTGLSVLLRAHMRAMTGELAPIRTVGARGPVAKLLKVSGVERILTDDTEGHSDTGEAEGQPLSSSRS